MSFVRTAAVELLKVQRAAIDGTRASARCCRAISDRAVPWKPVPWKSVKIATVTKEKKKSSQFRSHAKSIEIKRNETKRLGGRGLDSPPHPLIIFAFSLARTIRRELVASTLRNDPRIYLAFPVSVFPSMRSPGTLIVGRTCAYTQG